MVSMTNRRRVESCFCIHVVRNELNSDVLARRVRVELHDFIVVRIGAMGIVGRIDVLG